MWEENNLMEILWTCGEGQMLSWASFRIIVLSVVKDLVGKDSNGLHINT